MNIFLLSLIIAFGSLSTGYGATADIEAAIMNKNYDEAKALAIQELKNSMDIHERVQVEYYLGLSQLRLGEPATARSAFQIVMASAESGELYDRAALGMMEAYYSQGFYKEALSQGQKLIHKNPDSSVMSLIYLKLARTHLKLAHWKEAKEYLQKIIHEFPQSIEEPIARNLLEEKEYFAVQVGSFKDREKALNLTAHLNSTGLYAYIVQTTSLNEEPFYRVRVGRMTSLSNAQALEAQLTQLGYPTLIYP